MSLKLRLKRVGRHKDPHFRVVAVDSKKKRDGKVLEYLGHYHPQDKEPNCVLFTDKINKWIDNGAQVSDTVRNLISKQKKKEKSKK